MCSIFLSSKNLQETSWASTARGYQRQRGRNIACSRQTRILEHIHSAFPFVGDNALWVDPPCPKSLQILGCYGSSRFLRHRTLLISPFPASPISLSRYGKVAGLSPVGIYPQLAQTQRSALGGYPDPERTICSGAPLRLWGRVAGLVGCFSSYSSSQTIIIFDIMIDIGSAQHPGFVVISGLSQIL